MPKLSPPIGPISAAYIGLTGQASALTQLTSVRTNGASFTENLPSEYVVSQGNTVQNGNHSVSFVLTFLGKEDEVVKLCRGLSPFATDINAPPAQTRYALMVLGAFPNLGGCYYFPDIWTNKSVELSFSKGSPTTTVVTFSCENRDVTVPLFYEGPLSTMALYASGQYPL